MYPYQVALEASKNYFNGDDLAASVFVDKYALRNRQNEILELTPAQMHTRMAKEFARIEKKKFKNPLTEGQIFDLFDKFERIVPQGSPMYGIGNPYQFVSIGNCFVVPSPHDSYLGIMYTDTQITQISSRRGGVGWDVSSLRPKGMSVTNAAKTTSGCVEFMKRFSNTIREVGQNGRRGASLQCMSVHHPDIMEFIKVKRDRKQVTGSNISVKFTNEFMESLEYMGDYEQRWPIDNPVIRKKANCEEIWDEFITGARDHAEPGGIFWDTILEESTTAPYRQFGFIEEAPNPCGEQYLPPYASCRLILQNLYTYVKNKFTKDAYFDYKWFYEDAKLMQRLADDMVDLEIECIDRIIEKIKSDPEPQHIKQIGLDLWNKIRETSVKDRRTGCGFTGLADAIAAIGIKYGSDESVKEIEKIQKTLKTACFESSVDMAEELGPFPLYDSKLDITSQFIQRLSEENPGLYHRMVKFGRRNMTILTVAPAGTVSCETRTSSGLECVFMLMYTRRKKGNPGDLDFRSDFVDQSGDHWQEFTVYHKGLQDWMDVTGETDITKSPYYGACARDLDWVKRIDINAAIQKHCDNSLSVTINLPEDISREVVSEIFFTAWKKRCKGCTVYRENSRTGVLIENKKGKLAIDKHDAPKRPQEINCDIYIASAEKKKYFVLIGLLGTDPYEVFAGDLDGLEIKHNSVGKINKEKRGHYSLLVDDEVVCRSITKRLTDNEEAITRLISTSLRHGSNVKFIVNQLEKIEGPLHSLAKVIGRCLKKYIPDGEQATGTECPNCGNTELRYLEGCISCSCGFSKCG